MVSFSLCYGFSATTLAAISMLLSVKETPEAKWHSSLVVEVEYSNSNTHFYLKGGDNLLFPSFHFRFAIETELKYGIHSFFISVS